MSLYLVRHAEPLGSTLGGADPLLPDEDDGLTPHGHEQARRLAQRLAGGLPREGVRLISSPLRRARETCAHFEVAFGSKATLEPRIVESRLPPGATRADAHLAQIRAYVDPHAPTGLGEPVADHRARVDDWLAELVPLVRADPLRDIIVVSHGGTMEHAMAAFMGADFGSLANYYFEVPHASYHRLTPVFPLPGRMVWRIDAVSAVAGADAPAAAG